MVYEYGNQKFRTKADIVKYFQVYHNARDVGDVLEGDHKAVMIDLIKNHPNYDEWDVNGDVEFRIEIDEYKNKRYTIRHVARDDLGSTWHSFSYRKCIKGGSKEKNKRSNVMNAARKAIKDQILEFREQYKDEGETLPYKCAICCGKFKSIDVDHDFSKITFLTLLNDFIRINKNGLIQSFDLIDTPNGSILNPIDCDEWRQYHKKYAILRLLCRKCHQNKPTSKNFLRAG